MNPSSMTSKAPNSNSGSGRASIVTDLQLQQGLDDLKKGDEYRDRGDFDKAKTKYEKAARFCPSEAYDRLVILPLHQTSMESSASERTVPAGWRARAHHAKEKVKQVYRRPSPAPSLQQSFFPRPSLSTQSTVASLAISSSLSTLMSVSTCTTTSTSISQSSMRTLSTLASETAASELEKVSDVCSLKAAYEAADDEARGALKKRIYDIIQEFGQHPVIFDTLQELVVLADIHDRDIFLHLVTKILVVLRDTPLLSNVALQALAVILDLFPDDVDLGSMQGAFVEILASLQGRLRAIRIHNNYLQLMPLLSALNALLDAMVRRKVCGLDREAVYDELRTLLTGLTSCQNVMVCFQALYAKQSLAIIGNDESLATSVFRRGKLAFVLAGNITSMATKFELANAESAYQNIKGIFDFSIQDRWYQGLIYVDYLVGQRSWCQLEDFVLCSKFHSDVCFQLGVVMRLEQIAVVQMDVVVKEAAIKFLTALGDSPIPLVPEMVQGALRRLEQQQCSIDGTVNPKTYQNELRSIWDPAWLAAPKGILLKAVQDRDHRNATINSIPARLDAIRQSIQSQDLKAAQPSVQDIQSALKTYYKRDLAILRVSGETLDLETCFVNLAIVEAPGQRENDKQELREQAAIFHRIPSSEGVGRVNMQAPIPLEQLFDKRKLRNGEGNIPKEDIPKTILVQGRAGVGKTTLCKKLVHAHQTGLWNDRFDSVLWLPLRQIKAFKSRTLEELFHEKFFTRGLKQEGAALAHELAASAQQGRVLFVLDGLDEIAQKDIQCDDSDALKEFIRLLLEQQHVVITSRPSGLDRSLLPPTIDLELETIGFSAQNVQDFLSKVLSPAAVSTVQNFIRRTPLIQGLVNIPVQLDVICYSWDSLPTEGPVITMTRLYQLMVRKLWCKDALRLRKSAEGETLTQRDLNQLEPQEIDELMATEMQHLGYLAFKGLVNHHQIEFSEKAILSAFRDLRKHRATGTSRHLSPQMLEIMKQTSFLHTADANLDAGTSDSEQAWHFLHLTFQEYFAATWVLRHLQRPVPPEMQEYFSSHRQEQPLPVGMMTAEQAKAFVQEHKYNPRYEIMWWMVAGLLEGEALQDFFDLFQGAPRDLIGGRHQQILASCLNEARARLDTTVVARLDTELLKWVHLEINDCYVAGYKSILGSQSSFPEGLLVKTLCLSRSSAALIVNTLGSRSTQSDEAIRTLMHALKDGNTFVRKEAAWGLGRHSTLSEAVIQSLIGAVEDRDSDVRSFATFALCRQSTLSEATIQVLLGALKNRDKNVRKEVESALGRQSTLSITATQTLIKALKDEDLVVRSSAAQVLCQQSASSEAAIQSLVGALKDEHADVRSSATAVLSSQSTLSEVVTQSLIGAFQDESGNVRSSAAQVLCQQSTLSEAAIQSLVGALKDEHADVRSSAAAVLGSQSTLSEAVTQSLIGAFQDESGNVRSSAASALGKQSTLSEATIQSLIGALKNEEAHVRSSAAEALSSQSALSEEAIQSLIGAFKDENAIVRQSAGAALGKQSPLSGATVQFLIGALKHGKADVRSAAAQALGKQSALSEEAIQSLIVALKDNYQEVRPSAASALGKQAALSEAVIQSLLNAVEDRDPYIRSSATSILCRQPTLSEAAIQSLTAALKDEETGIRSSAVTALGNQSSLSEATIQSLIGSLKDENQGVRRNAVSALNKRSALSEATVQSLICTLKDETAYVRSSAASALGNLSTLSEAAIQSLIGALNDEAADVRSSAASALGKQTALSEAAIQSLIGALNDELAYVRSSAASALGKQTALPETAIQFLIGALKDEIVHDGTGARSLSGKQATSSEAASILGNQSTLSEAAIQSLIDILKDKNANARVIAASVLGTQSRLSAASIQSIFGARNDQNARRYVDQILAKHCHSLCLALASLSESEIRIAYKNHIFRYSCQHVMSLQVQDNRLCMYTVQGLERTEPLDVEKVAIIASAFETVQQNAWKRLDKPGHDILPPFVVQ